MRDPRPSIAEGTVAMELTAPATCGWHLPKAATVEGDETLPSFLLPILQGGEDAGRGYEQRG